MEAAFKKIEQCMNGHKGFARMSELRNAGIQTRDIAEAVRQGLLARVARGLYKLTAYPFDEHETLAMVSRFNENAVICLLSAAGYYNLTTFIPPQIYTAVPRNTPRFRLAFPPVRLYYFNAERYQTGIEIIKTSSVDVKMYSREKTIVDLFHYKDKLGEDAAIESLKTYVASKQMNLSLFIKTAQQLGGFRTIEPYLKGML